MTQIGKICSRCKQFKIFTEFYSRKNRPGGFKSECKACSNLAHARYMQENHEKMITYQREYWRDHPDKVRENHLKYKFGLTRIEYDAILASQDGSCKACGTTEPKGRGTFHIDHDHICCPGYKSCGECIRGLLCSSCNIVLGHVNDDPERLRRLADYIEKSQVNKGVTWHDREP